ncbi:hypothetical protein A9Q82_05635 [Cycloclasticus sp. 46_120_T64]|nr:hypothetical protein A9Q82_05635 [Cycloclasticus sp. 46_120_T64]
MGPQQLFIYFLASLGFLGSSPLLAQHNGGLDFFHGEAPVVLSATRLAQPQIEAPATISIIDRQMIQLSGAKNIADLFRLVPGMHVANFRGNRAIVGYQGLSSEYPQGVQVLIDGKSEYSPLFGGVNWATFPLLLEDIERIEISRGPNGATFGSNAFQSVINIMTSHSQQLQGSQLKVTLANRGYQRTIFRHGLHTKQLDLRLSISQLDDAGYANNFDDTRQSMLNTRADYSFNQQDSLQINLNALNTLRETANPDDPNDPFDPRRQQDESYYSIATKWQRSINSDEQLSAKLSYTLMNSKDAYSHDASTLFGAGANYSADQSASYDRWDFEFEQLTKPNDNTRIAWGFGLRSDRVSLPFWIGDDKKYDNSLQRIFSNIEWRVSQQLIINTGALWEHTQLSGHQLSPRFALNYLVNEQQSLRLIVSRAYRSPVPVENQFNAEHVIQTAAGELRIPVLNNNGNTIRPETINSLELGYHGRYWHNALVIDFKLFRNEYDHLVDTDISSQADAITLNGLTVAHSPLTPNPAPFLSIHNCQAADVNGFELELNYRPNRQDLLHLTYSHNHVTANADPRLQASIPTDTFSLLAAHHFNAEQWASVAFYYTGSMRYKNSGQQQGPTRRLDLNAGTKLKVSPRQNIDINLGLQLALDTNTDFLTAFKLDNRAFVEASVNFN